MRFRSIAVVTLLSCAASAVRAQNATCVAPTTDKHVRDACQQAVDMFNYMVPQLGISITGGNATLAQGGALGGFPHFTLGLRANVLAGSLPKPQIPDTTGAQARAAYPTSNQFLGLPAVDAAIGLFKGVPLGLTNVGGVDLLLSATYIPKIDATSISINPDSPLKIGYGVRVGLLQESLVVPGVGFTYFRRDLPTTTLIAISPAPLPSTGTDSLIVRDFAMKTNAWRISASKSLILFSLAAGVGQDTYDASTSIKAFVQRTLPIIGGQTYQATAAVKTKVTRTNYFADLSMNILLLKIVGEVGMVSGGKIPTYNTFDPKADASHMYGSVGIRLGL
jgi:hypothetical protein